MCLSCSWGWSKACRSALDGIMPKFPHSAVLMRAVQGLPGFFFQQIKHWWADPHVQWVQAKAIWRQSNLAPTTNHLPPMMDFPLRGPCRAHAQFVDGDDLCKDVSWHQHPFHRQLLLTQPRFVLPTLCQPTQNKTVDAVSSSDTDMG